MDNQEKDATRDRFLKNYKKHFRTREEQKAIAENSRARRAHRERRRPRHKDWRGSEEDEEAQAFERIQRGPRVSLDRERKLPDLGLGGPEQEAQPNATEGTAALVIAVHKDRLRVRNAQGAELDALLPASSGRERPRIAVGDRVRVQAQPEGAARTLALEPRRSVLARPDPGDPRRELVLAANVDVAVIVIAARSPAFKPALVDRVRIALERGGVAPFVCVNKIDLVEDEALRARIEQSLASWRALEVPGALVSAESGTGLDDLRAAVRDKTCVFVGHSGVGKSSLLNALDPEGARLTGRVRTGDGKGRHTTTSSQLVELSDGTQLIDTPGVRQFGLSHVGRAEVDAAFPDVMAFAGSCRFSDCAHAVEPDCAVRAATESGALEPARLEAWRRLAQEVEG